MNKFVFGALAVPLLSATGLATDTEWPELDRELAALSSAPMTQESGGPYFNGWLIGVFDYNADAEATVGTSTVKEQVGFDMRAARIALSGTIAGNYDYHIGYDFFDQGELWREAVDPTTTGVGGITDAYAAIMIQDYVNVRMGVYNVATLRSSTVQRNHTLFIDRSWLGQQDSNRELGVGLYGNFSRVNWYLDVANGYDGTAEGMEFAARVDFDILGKLSAYEGAYGAPEGTNLNVGLVYQDDSSDEMDGSSRSASTFAVDATLVAGGFSVFGEMIGYDKDNGAYYFSDYLNTGTYPATPGMVAVDHTPWSIGASYLFAEVYEVAVRYDDWDDLENSNRFNLGLNRYVYGHDVKWQVQYALGDSDGTGTSAVQANDWGIFSVGLAVGF
jgi:hypothetical protein